MEGNMSSRVRVFHEVHKDSEANQQLSNLFHRDTGKSAGQLYRHWRNSELDARIFTDSWPHCSCVVVVAYWQLNLDDEDTGIERHTADHLMNSVLEPHHSSMNIASYYKVFSLLTPVTGEIILPKGFFIQSLQPSHAEFIATHHPYYKLHYRLAQLHFKYCLSNPSVGVFTDTMPPNLVCWIVRSYDGSLHHLYTLEQYRRRGLATAAVRMMCKHIQDQGDVPFCCILTNNHSSSTLFTTLGFTESQEQFLLIKTNQEIISQ